MAIAFSPSFAHFDLSPKLEPGHAVIPQDKRESYNPASEGSQSFLSAVQGIFESNRGQADAGVRFLARTPGGTVFLSPNEFSLWFSGSSTGDATKASRDVRRILNGPRAEPSKMRVRLVGSRHQAPLSGVNKLPGQVNYLTGQVDHLRGPNSRTRTLSAATYRKVKYRGIYPGIDLLFHSERGPLEYDFVVAPGADPGMIILEFDGFRPILDSRGDLILVAGSQRIRQKKPLIYQGSGPDDRRVSGGYSLLGGHRVGFKIGKFDRSRPLVIDPVLPFSTRIGGGRDENIEDVLTDAKGNIYIAGWTSSSDLPMQDRLQRGYGGYDCQFFTQRPCGDAFLAKYDSHRNLIYSTFLGGSGSDAALDMAVDSAGSVYLAGRTDSDNFPGADPAERRAKEDAFVAKVSPQGDRLVFSALLGGNNDDQGSAIAIDTEGRAYVTGSTSSIDFPTVKGLQPAAPGGNCPGKPPAFSEVPCSDAFVAKIEPSSGNEISYSTFVGGKGNDSGTDIAVDPEGNTYIAGETGSENFPTTNAGRSGFGGGDCPLVGQRVIDLPGAGELPVQTEPCTDAFVTKLDAGGSAFRYSRFVGGSGPDSAKAIALDPSGKVTLIGRTASKDFPIVRGFQRRLGGGVCVREGGERNRVTQPCSDAFVSTLNADGSSLSYSTYLGGIGSDEANDVALDRSGRPYVVGLAEGGFPAKRAMQARSNGHTDAFIALLDPRASGASSLAWSTFFGGSGREYADAIALDRSGAAFVAGQTDSRSDFPSAPPSSKFVEGEQLDAFVAKLSPSRRGSPLVNQVVPRSGSTSGGAKIEIRGENLTNVQRVHFGRAKAKDFDVSNDGRRLTATTPRHSKGTVSITVTTSRGSSGSLPEANFTFAQGGWTSIGGPDLFHHTSTVLPDGKVLVAGGCSKIDDVGLCGSGGSRLAYIFDPAAGTWKKTAPMQIPRVGHTATLLPRGPKSLCGTNCGKVLVVGYMRGFCAELYDIKQGRWTRLKSTSPDDLQLRPLSNKMCSEDLPEAGHVPAGHQVATLLPSGPGAICGKRCGQVLFTGYTSSPSALFDPRSNKWTITGLDRTSPESLSAPRDPLSIPTRSQHTATLLPNGQVLLVGGITVGGIRGAGEAAERAIIYDPVQDKFSHRPGPTVVRYGAHTATLLSDGTVLVAGGMTDNLGTMTPAAEIYDPAAPSPTDSLSGAAWRPAGNLNVGRFGHAAVRLSGGEVMIAGGTEVTGDPNARRPKFGSAPSMTEIYRPATKRWVQEGVLNDGRTAGIMFAGGNATFASRTFTLDRLTDGRLIVIGGKDGELYVPADHGIAAGGRRPSDSARTWGWVGMLVVAGALLAGAWRAKRMAGTRSATTA